MGFAKRTLLELTWEQQSARDNWPCSAKPIRFAAKLAFIKLGFWLLSEQNEAPIISGLLSGAPVMSKHGILHQRTNNQSFSLTTTRSDCHLRRLVRNNKAVNDGSIRKEKKKRTDERTNERTNERKKRKKI